VGADAKKEGGLQYIYTYMDCTVRESLGAKFLEASAPSKQTPPFLTLYAETRFWHFKEPTPFKKIRSKKHRRFYAKSRRRFNWFNIYPPSFLALRRYIKRIMVVNGLEREQEFSHKTIV
jgi:hypothetical protein